MPLLYLVLVRHESRGLGNARPVSHVHFSGASFLYLSKEAIRGPQCHSQKGDPGCAKTGILKSKDLACCLHFQDFTLNVLLFIHSLSDLSASASTFQISLPRSCILRSLSAHLYIYAFLDRKMIFAQFLYTHEFCLRVSSQSSGSMNDTLVKNFSVILIVRRTLCFIEALRATF